MLKKLFWILVVLLLIAVAVWFFLKPQPPTTVSVIQAETQTLSTHLDLNAVVVNDQVVTITALLNGEIGQIKAREGASVKKGQALALLDNQEAQSLLDKARAELDYKQQKLNSASRTYSRIKSLSGAGNASRQQLDDSLDALRSAQADLSVSEATVTLAELHLQNASINAPFNGTITKQHAETGQWVEAGTPLFTLVATDGYLIEAQVDASDWAQVSMDQSVLLNTETAKDHEWQSQVSWIAPTVALNERDAKSVAIRFPFGDDAPELLLGQELSAELVLDRVEDVMTLPLSAMIETEPGQYGVYIAENNKTKFQAVEVGLQNATHAEIISGLSESDKVIAARQQSLSDGMSIEIR